MSKRKKRIYPEDEAQLYIRSATDKPGLMERFIDSYKGRGVFACQPIEPGTFVLEYRGELLSMKECQSRSYSEQESTFLFEFEWQNHQWCIDASKEDGSLGRLVNDNHKSPNCTMKKIVVNGKPHLCLFSVKKIEVGTEIDYNYGKSKWPWRKKVTTFQTSSGATSTGTPPTEQSEDDGPSQVDPRMQVHCVPVHPFSPSTPNDKIVDFGEEDEYVPKLKRTKSILMDRLPDFSDALFDSSDDEEGLSKSKSEMVSQRPSRSQSCPLEHSLTSSDEMSGSSGDEYVPNPKEDYTDSDVSTETLLGSQKKRKCTRRKRKSSSQDLCNDSVSPSIDTSQDFTQRLDANKDESVSLEENPSVFVYPVSKKEDGSRCYNKKHQCLYCDKVIQKMSRHLKRKHMDKVDVAKAFSLPKNSKERRAQLDYIRNKGNFKHNNEVLENHEGKLIPSKQPNKKTDGQIFTHCVYCFGLFKKKLMWRHFQACKLKPQIKPSKQGKSRVQALCAFAEPAPSGLSDPYWKFLSYMNQDKIAVSIKQDLCILEYGYRLFTKNEKTISQHQYIRQKLRELGRLLLEAKKDAPVKTIKDLIKPEKYNFIVGVVKRLSGFSEETGRFQRPSLARKVGHSLHSLAMFIKSEGLKNQDKTVVQKADEFAQLYQESWKFDVASQALTQLDQTKWQSPQVLPFTEDVQVLHRRAGEVSRMPLSFYLSKDTSETHEDVNMALTALEQKLCKHFVRITIVGKRGRHVPVLLTPLMKQSLDALIENREGCGVLNDNGYLFALPYSVHYLRGSDSIRQFVSECDGIKNPKALTSTKLRKHIATLSTVLNLKNTELDQLADFLGHNIQVHRKHYRLPEGTLQLAKISKVLLAMEQGRLGDYKGKSLDEINVDVNETVDADGYAQEDMEGNQISPSLSSFWTKNLMKLMDVPKKMWKMVMLLRCSQRLSQHPSKNTPNKVAKNGQHKKEMLLLLTLWSWKRSAQHPKKVTSPQRR
uniref:SET domain-containing protein n=1 Tax=Oryzias latipes TaxID=8090 RepID=A0A3P9M1A8_ORYLA